MGFLFGMKPFCMLQSVLASITDPKTLSLTAVVSLILVLSHSMELAGQMERLLEKFRGLVRSPRLKMIVFPAVIGLLPMPGGAIFSAPMVKTLGKRFELSGPQLSYINYWFRHIWEYWWPLYPGVLLTTTLSRLDLWVFVLFISPLTVVAFCAGYLPLRKTVPPSRAEDPGPNEKRPPVLPFVKELAPILMAIVLGIGMGSFLSSVSGSQRLLGGIAKETGLVLALLTAIWWVWRQNRFTAAQKWQVLGKRQLFSMILMVFSVFIFKGILEDSGAVTGISGELLRMRIPLMPICVIFPFLVGGVAGITVAFVGATFPVLIALIKSFGEDQFILGYMMLALVSGFMGVLLSPLHLCLLLSNQYFEAGMLKVYRYLWFPVLILMLCGAFYFSIFRWIIPG